MTEQSQEDKTTSQEPPKIGQKMKSAREALSLSAKDVSHQLRLKESVIDIIEADQLPGDIPLAFARGYLRTYGRFLNLEQQDIDEAVLNLAHKSGNPTKTSSSTKKHLKLVNNQVIMRLTTSMITVTLVGLVVSWWFNHKPETTHNALLATQINTAPKALPTKIELNTKSPIIDTAAITEKLTQGAKLAATQSNINTNLALPPQPSAPQDEVKASTSPPIAPIKTTQAKPASKHPAEKALKSKPVYAQNSDDIDDYDDYDDAEED